MTVLDTRSPTTTPQAPPGPSPSPVRASRPHLDVELRGLVKVYPGGQLAVDGVDLNLRRGEVFTLVGPNGAGKTTLIRVLSTQLRPTRGGGRVLGFDLCSEPRKIRDRLALVPQEARPDPYLKVREHIVYYLLARGMRRREARRAADEVTTRLELDDRLDDLVGNLSGGMRRRVLLSMALATGSPLMILDEPTSGLDLLVRRKTWDALMEARRHSTMLLTTHSMEEAAALSDRVGILHRGQLVAVGTPRELLDLAPGRQKVVVEQGALTWPTVADLGHVQASAGKWAVFPRDDEALRKLLDLSVERRTEAAVHNSSLEDVFVHLVEGASSMERR